MFDESKIDIDMLTDHLYNHDDTLENLEAFTKTKAAKLIDPTTIIYLGANSSQISAGKFREFLTNHPEYNGKFKEYLKTTSSKEVEEMFSAETFDVLKVLN